MRIKTREELDSKDHQLRLLVSEKVCPLCKQVVLAEYLFHTSHFQRDLERSSEILQARVNRLQATARMTSVDLARLDLESAEFVQRYSGSEVSDVFIWGGGAPLWKSKIHVDIFS